MKKPFKRPAPPRRRPVKSESVSPAPSKGKIIFINDVLERTGNPSKVTIWRWVKRGILPPPRVLGGRNVWFDTEIDERLNNLARRQCYRVA